MERLLRGGYIREIGPGLYGILPIGNRVVEQIKAVIRREFNSLEGEEFLLPLLTPAELWSETGRDQVIADQLTYVNDRQDQSLVICPSHEEACIAMARLSFSRIEQLPAFLYQFQLKFRDEAPHQMGLVRAREFLMADGFSIHSGEVGLNNFFPKVYKAFQQIFAEFGLEVIISPGAAEFSAGDLAYEILVPAKKGEHTLVTCQDCGYSANQDVAVGLFKTKSSRLRALETVSVEGKTLDQVQSIMGVPESRMVHCALVHTVHGLVLTVLRGDQRLSRDKVSRLLGEPVIREVSAQELEDMGFGRQQLSPINLPQDLIQQLGIQIIVDTAVADSSNLIIPSREVGTYFVNANFGRDYSADMVGDIAKVSEACRCYHCGGELVTQKVVKLAHLYRMGDLYSRSMHFSLIDDRGDTIYPHLGSYGLGVGRLMATVAEYRSDHKSLCWPLSISPFKAHLVVVGRGQTLHQIAEEVYNRVHDLVLWDDRPIPVTEKFRDADRIGIPVRIVISSASLDDGNLMLSHRLLSPPARIPFHRVRQRIEELQALELSKGPQSSPGLSGLRHWYQGEEHQ